jgi:hypothetical protein
LQTAAEGVDTQFEKILNTKNEILPPLSLPLSPLSLLHTHIYIHIKFCIALIFNFGVTFWTIRPTVRTTMKIPE